MENVDRKKIHPEGCVHPHVKQPEGFESSTIESSCADEQCEAPQQSQREKLKKKLSVFERFLLELVAKKRDEEVSNLSKDEVNETLASYSMISLNTLLYLACLADVEYDSVQRKATPGKLLKLFDNFQAWDNGPSEYDVYLNGETLDHFSYIIIDDPERWSRVCYFQLKVKVNVHDVLHQLGDDYKGILCGVLKTLNCCGFLGLSDGEIMWRVCNKFYAWKNCFDYGVGISKFLEKGADLYRERAVFEEVRPVKSYPKNEEEA